MTQHEQQIRQHCQEHHIQVRTLPSGALHFVGPGVEIKAASMRCLTVENLAPYEPQKYVDMYAS